MGHNTKFEQPEEYKVILRDSYLEDVYYGLDSFDCKYLKIIQAKFGCYNSLHTIPDRVKMELAPYIWNKKKQKFVLDDYKSMVVQINQLEFLVVNYKYSKEWHEMELFLN